MGVDYSTCQICEKIFPDTCEYYTCVQCESCLCPSCGSNSANKYGSVEPDNPLHEWIVRELTDRGCLYCESCMGDKPDAEDIIEYLLLKMKKGVNHPSRKIIEKKTKEYIRNGRKDFPRRKRMSDEKKMIPTVSKSVIKRLATKIKPVIQEKKKLYYIKEKDLFNVAFTWDPEKSGEAKGLKELERITTYHTCGHYMLFKPSINEVLSQIPENLLKKTVAFKTFIDNNKNINELLTEDQCHHIATTVLYEKDTACSSNG